MPYSHGAPIAEGNYRCAPSRNKEGPTEWEDALL